MRADRLLSILLLLQRHHRLTAQELAERLEVSVRTIYRDMEALSGAGIPVLAERGSGGGWSLLEGYRSLLSGLKEQEIRSLFIARSERLLSELGWVQESRSALTKLLHALPPDTRNEIEYLRQRLHIDPTGWHGTKEDVSSLSVLQEAIWQEKKLWLTYQGSSGNISRRLVDPLGLVAKGSVWYLVALRDGELRTYRVSRIAKAAATDEAGYRPSGFDLAAYWSEHTARFIAELPRFPVIVLAEPSQLPYIRMWRFARIAEESAPTSTADQRICLTIWFESEAEACQYALSLGTRIEVIEPQSLREQLAGLARSVREMYAPDGTK